MTTIAGLLEVVFSAGSAPRLYNEDTSRAAVYILYIRLGFNSKIVNNCTNDNELILPTMTDKRPTDPTSRERGRPTWTGQ
jgi:hypothetical protein